MLFDVLGYIPKMMSYDSLGIEETRGADLEMGERAGPGRSVADDSARWPLVVRTVVHCQFVILTDRLKGIKVYDARTLDKFGVGGARVVDKSTEAWR